MFHLHMDSSHFSWDAYGATAEEAATAFQAGWRKWCRKTGADRDYWGLTLAELATEAREVRLGVCYVDGSPV